MDMFVQKCLVLSMLLLPTLAKAQMKAMTTDGPRGKIGFYQYLPPGYNTDTIKRPMIIFLHGIGEKGTGSEADLEKIKCCGIPKYIARGDDMQFTWNGKTEGFVVLMPQLASRYGTWDNYYIDAMLGFAKTNLNIDTNRIFLTGLSLGAGASWVYTSASLSNARKIAGIVPVASPCFMTNGCNIANANLPVLAMHALDDDLASYKCTVNAIESINNCGAAAKPNLVLWDNGGHYIWTKRAFDTEYTYFNPNIYEWMLAQNRSFKPNIKPVANAGNDTTITTTSGRVILDGSASFDPDGKITRYVWQKISGPSFEVLSHDVTSSPEITNLTYPGIYTFQLRAVDDRAEWASDTVRVTVVNGNVLQ